MLRLQVCLIFKYCRTFVDKAWEDLNDLDIDYRNGKVPEVLLATIDLPTSLQTNGQSCLLQAQICRPKRDCKGEMGAKEVSDSLPFLEYELHRRFVNKLKVKGMNAVFGFKVTMQYVWDLFNV